MKGVIKKVTTKSMWSNPLIITIGVILILIVVLAIFKPTSPFLNLGLGVNAHIGNIKGSFELEAFENNGEPACVLFMSPNCGHCKRMKPEWDKFRQTNPKVIQTIDCSDPENSKLARSHGVDAYPTIRFYKNGLADKDTFVEHQGERDQSSFMGFFKSNYSQ